MGYEVYRHPNNQSKEDRGHDAKCEFVDNHGPSCGCDYNNGDQYEFPRALTVMGWKREPSMPKYSWFRQYGPHRLSISKGISGWKYMLVKGCGMTILDSRSFGTPIHAIDHMLGSIVEQVDWGVMNSWESMARKHQLEQASIEPKVMGVKLKPVPPAEPGPLKHEVTAIMDGVSGD